MTPNDNRIDLLGEIIDEYHVDGVVEVILSGCHSTGAESYYIKKFVNEEKHLPYISIDTDYSTADMGQIVTRLTAFIEMIQTEKIGSPRSGTGDIFAAIIAADAVNGTGLTESVRKASGFIGKCIQRSVELEIPLADGICFEELLYLLK